MEDESVSDDEWFRMTKALFVMGFDACQTELDDYVLQCEKRERWYEQFEKRWADYKRENNISDLGFID